MIAPRVRRDFFAALESGRILLASHGTAGSRAAEQAALDLCREPGVDLFHLTVVPDFWRGMMGDDWLNNVSTRDAYCKHLESELAREIEQHRQAIEPQAALRGAHYHPRVVIGKPAECLLDLAAEINPDLIVIGSPRPPGTGGLHSRMEIEKLLKRLAASLLIVPYPR